VLNEVPVPHQESYPRAVALSLTSVPLLPLSGQKTTVLMYEYGTPRRKNLELEKPKSPRKKIPLQTLATSLEPSFYG
jgi:hypothetical protein